MKCDSIDVSPVARIHKSGSGSRIGPSEPNCHSVLLNTVRVPLDQELELLPGASGSSCQQGSRQRTRYTGRLIVLGCHEDLGLWLHSGHRAEYDRCCRLNVFPPIRRLKPCPPV